jgi:hypothetical protein
MGQTMPPELNKVRTENEEMAIEEMKNFMESNETKMKKEEAGKSREGAHLSVKPVKVGQSGSNHFHEPAFCAESAEKSCNRGG